MLSLYCKNSLKLAKQLPSKIKLFFSKTATKVAVLFMGVAILIAVFAYPLATDDTTNANNMIVELSAKPIGYKTQVLSIPKLVTFQPNTQWHEFWNGKPNSLLDMPINAYYFKNDSLYVNHYIDENLAENLQFPLSLWATNDSTVIKKQFIRHKQFLLGTDRYGRDIYSRLLLGTRISLGVGIISMSMSIIIGFIMGAIAGWYGKWVDGFIMWIINILWAIPTLLLIFAITITIGKVFWAIFVAIGLTSWVSTARLIRGQVMQIKNQDYIIAAKTLGIPDFQIIIRHILPNIIGPIMVIAASNFASAILVEAGLSFLGFGVQPPTPSWGLMIKEHYSFLIAGNPIPALIPGLAIMLLVLALNIIGNQLRDTLDVKN